MKRRTTSFVQNMTQNGSLPGKLLWAFFILILIPMTLFTLYTFHRLKEVTKEQTLIAAQKTFDEVGMAMDDVTTKLGRVVNILTMDPILYRMSSNDPQDCSYIQRLEDSHQLATSFAHLRTLSGVNRIRLYVHNDYLYSGEQYDITQAKAAENSRWYRSLGQSATRENDCIWITPADLADQQNEEQQWFGVAQVIYNLRDFDEPQAVLRADISAQRVEDIMEDTAVTPNAVLLLLRGDQALLVSGSVGELNVKMLAGELQPERTGTWETLCIGEKHYFCQCRTIANAGWTLATVLPYTDVYRSSNELRLEMLGVMLIVSALAYLVAYAICRSTLTRLSVLAETMHAVENGDVAARVKPQGTDEVGQLMESFSAMMTEMDALMEQKVEYGRQIKNLELKALQAQINPHFLYNSLDLINCTAIARNVPEISRMVNALARFYKISLSRGQEVISLEEEFRHAQLYLQIQNMRFDDRVQVEWNIGEHVVECRVIKIILQPIIENAVIHGIFERPDKTGKIVITAERRNDTIDIAVEDNGVGMSEEIQKRNFAASSPGNVAVTSGGYGVRNIQDRLKLAYGEAYGLYCESVPGKGTTVTIHIPAVTE